MKRALTFAAGFTAGYVAGAKAGHEKYEQMKDKMHEVSQQPAVAEMRETIQGQVGSATKAVADKVTGVASGLSEKLHGSSEDDDSRSSKKDTAKAAVGEYPEAPNGVVPGKNKG